MWARGPTGHDLSLSFIMWFDMGRILSKQRQFNFILSPRGTGKTTAARNWMIKNALKTDNTYAVIRRRKPDLESTVSGFMSSANQFFPALEWKTAKERTYIKQDGVWHPIIDYFALSVHARRRGIELSKLKLIIFDEFTIDTRMEYSRYLQNEVVTFLSLYDTIARPASRPAIPCIFFGNHFSEFNPYFQYFNFTLNAKHPTYMTEHIYAELYEDAEFTTRASESWFYDLLKGTEYGEHSVKGKQLRQDDYFIKDISDKGKPWFNGIYKGDSFTVWDKSETGFLYVSKIYDKGLTTYAFTIEDSGPNVLMRSVFQRGFYADKLRRACEYGAIYYQSQHLKDVFDQCMCIAGIYR